MSCCKYGEIGTKDLSVAEQADAHIEKVAYSQPNTVFLYFYFDVTTSLVSLDRGSNWEKVTSHASHSRLRAVPVGGVWFTIWRPLPVTSHASHMR